MMRPYRVSDEKAQIGDLNFLLDYILLTREILDFGGPQVDIKSFQECFASYNSFKKLHSALQLKVTI